MSAVLIKDAQIVTATDLLRADVLVRGGTVAQIAFHDSPGYALPSVQDDPVHEVVEARGLLLFPGFIDCHVHFREPGLEHKGDMRSESRAALAGGVTTVCDMPNTIPPTNTVSALADKVRRAEEIRDCDIRFFFGVTQDIHLAALRELWAGGNAELERLKARCVGVKVFFDHSTGDQGVDTAIIDDIFKACAEEGIPLVCHCEDPALNAAAMRRYADDESIHPTVSRHSFVRPPESEAKAIEHAISLSKKYGTAFHVAHLSTQLGVDLIRQAKANGVHVTCEAAPHHLFLTEDAYRKLGTLGKMNPPLRSSADRDALWKGIADRTIDCVATDHAPHALEEKTDAEPLRAPSGVPGVETMIPLLMTVAGGEWPHEKDPKTARLQIPTLRMQDVLRLCFENPNRIYGLGKSGIDEGAKADLVLIDPSAEWTVHAKDLHAKCGWTPYEGWRVKGKVERVVR